MMQQFLPFVNYLRLPPYPFPSLASSVMCPYILWVRTSRKSGSMRLKCLRIFASGLGTMHHLSDDQVVLHGLVVTLNVGTLCTHPVLRAQVPSLQMFHCANLKPDFTGSGSWHASLGRALGRKQVLPALQTLKPYS